MPVISQRDNYLNKHGLVYRSSATFYAKSDEKTNTIISFMNYFKFKNGIIVSFVISLRDMAGDLLLRECGDFATNAVQNLNLNDLISDFEGSVEIEFYSSSELKIPFSAVIGYYITQDSITAVHTYARNLNNYEIEASYPLTHAFEGNFSLRDDSALRSFFIFHNGSQRVPAQELQISFKNSTGNTHDAKFLLSKLSPYQTVKVYLDQIFLDLVKFVDSKYASCSIEVSTGGSFTRMLVGNEHRISNEVQITHSNFDYSKVESDMCDIDQQMYMSIPNFNDKNLQSVILYPTNNIKKASFSIQSLNSSGQPISDEQIVFSSGKCPLEINLNKAAHAYSINIQSLDKSDPLPTRLPFGLCTKNNSCDIGSEMSLGAYTSLRPSKRFHWIHFYYSQESSFCTTIFASAIQSIYGNPCDSIICRVYLESEPDFYECTLLFNDLSSGIPVKQILQNVGIRNCKSPGYMSFFSDYGGLMIYSRLSTLSGKTSIEHSF